MLSNVEESNINRFLSAIQSELCDSICVWPNQGNQEYEQAERFIPWLTTGISEIVARPFKSQPSFWTQSVELARSLLQEAEVRYREV
jgi:hypothetical protein